MSGPTITVQLDASAVAGVLHVTESIGATAREKGLLDLEAEMRSMRLALEGGLRAHGWTPLGNGQWEQRPSGRRRR